MYVARLVCSDERCAEELVAEAATLAELETLACACGCGLALIAWPDAVDAPSGELLALAPRAPSGDVLAA